MKKLKKLLSIAVFCLITICSAFTLTACNLVVTDKTAFYEQTIATYTYNNKEYNVTMSQLNSAFRDYGYSNYVNGYYSTIEDCLNDSLNYHIQSSLLMYELETKVNQVYLDTNNQLYDVTFADLTGHDWNTTLENIYNSNKPNALEIRYDAFASMQKIIDNYCISILQEEERFEEIETETEETLRDEKTEYESKLVIDETAGTIRRNIEELQLFEEDNVAKHFTLANNYDANTTQKAYVKYINYLQQIANGEGKSTKESDVILNAEKDAIRKAYLSKLIELFQYRYETTSIVEIDTLVDYYKNQFEAQQNQFEYNLEAYHTAMEKYTSEYVYYHSNSGSEYVLINHILINFTENQKQQIKDLETQLNLDVANFPELKEELEADYNDAVMSIVLNTQSEYEVDGVKQTGYISEIIEEIDTVVNNSVDGSVITEDEVRVRAEAFDKLLYKYNDDPGAMNTDFKYAVKISGEYDDKYDKAFALAAKKLYDNYQVGDVLMEPVVSQYGIHILFYSGVAENIVNENAIEQLTYEDLMNSRVNPASNKSVLEYLYDKLNLTTSFNSYTTNLINQLFNSSTIVIDSYKFSNGLV